MIVLTLKATAIKSKTGLILTECKMAKLQSGDLLHALPDVANALAAKYPDNLKREGVHHDIASWPEGARYIVEPAAKAAAPEAAAKAPASPAPAPAPAAAPADAAAPAAPQPAAAARSSRAKPA